MIYETLYSVIETNEKVIPHTSAKYVPKTTGFAEKGAHCSAMSQEKIPYFRTAITAIFKNWTALQLAVNHVSCFRLLKIIPKSTFSLRMLVVCKARRKLNGWRNPLKPGSMKTKTLSLMRYDKILTLILGGKVLDTQFDSS